MALPKFTLSHDDKKDDWVLKNDQTNRTVERWDIKEEATQRGELKEAVGLAGGSVRIQKENGRYQEERTYPKSKDPTKTPE